MSLIRDFRRDELFDYAVANPGGVTIEDITSDLAMSRAQANIAIRDVRMFLCESGDSINLAADPQGQNDPWLYRLVGTVADAQPWASNRVRDTESRIRTQKAVWCTIVAATDGRSTDGRKARVMQRAFNRLIEDLDTIIDEA